MGERGRLFKKTPAATCSAPSPSSYISLARRESPREITLCIKTHLVWKRYECGPPGYSARSRRICWAFVWASRLTLRQRQDRLRVSALARSAGGSLVVTPFQLLRVRRSADGSLVVAPFQLLRAWRSADSSLVVTPPQLLRARRSADGSFVVAPFQLLRAWASSPNPGGVSSIQSAADNSLAF